MKYILVLTPSSLLKQEVLGQLNLIGVLQRPIEITEEFYNILVTKKLVLLEQELSLLEGLKPKEISEFHIGILVTLLEKTELEAKVFGRISDYSKEM